MKTKKLLDKLRDILSAERHAQLEEYASLKKVLKDLRTEKQKLKKRLASESNEVACEDLAFRLRVISKQRKKGLKVLKELKEERQKARK